MLNPLSWRNIPTARTLFVMIFLAGAGLIISVVALLYLSLHLISSKANEIDEHRAALAVQGAIQTSVNRMRSLGLDNAVWDEAVRVVYRTPMDTGWLYNTWGAGFKVDNLYDGTFVLDEHFAVVWGAFRSLPFNERNLAFFGDGLAALIRNHAAALQQGKDIFAGITRTRRGVAFVSIGLIRPVSGRLDKPNRRALIEQLDQWSEWGNSDLISVVFIDLDGFKDVNDIYGHDVGDRLIVTIAQTLQEKVPTDGMLARMGGDEFAMTLSGPWSVEKAADFAQMVLDYFCTPVRIGKRSLHISASIGIASGTLVECSSSELFRRADIAMYHSKMCGKARMTHYDAALNSARERQLMIENDIRDGLEREEFDVWYQPIIDARSGKMSGVEALARWPRRPDGELKPDEFIPIAETSGLIYALGQFVLRRACRDLYPQTELKLSVNISPAQFRDPEFEDKVAQVLETCRFPAQRLQLEVTETYVLENPERAQAAIANLKALGTAVALDDFGTGYSSIGYLRRFNFDTIKIDKSLAGLVDNDEQASALVSGTIRIASALGMQVVAEGVENETQMALLRDAGCDQLQGFYFSAPMPLERLLQHHLQRQE